MKECEKEEPTIAPGMNTHDPLEKKATEEEIEKGDYTSVTRLFLDRTLEE
ncbi:hypothetical protein [Paenibacillus sp. R14(2021)]|nr:hypothetical protein [Paenibacillus sp. R14(2021)]